MGMVHTPCQADLIRDHGCQKTRKYGVVAHPSNCQHFQREDCAGQRGAKHRGKTGADTGHQQDPPIFMLELE